MTRSWMFLVFLALTTPATAAQGPYRCPPTAAGLGSILAKQPTTMISPLIRLPSGSPSQLEKRRYDPHGLGIMGVEPVKVEVSMSFKTGQPQFAYFWLPGASIAAYRPKFEAMMGGWGRTNCSDVGCSWSPDRVEPGAIQEVHLSKDSTPGGMVRFSCTYDYRAP